MGRHIDTLPRVRLMPADWARVEAMAQRESRSVANMLGVLVREAMAARDAATLPQGLVGVEPDVWQPAITRPERAQKGATK